jgi:hypothetical protein
MTRINIESVAKPGTEDYLLLLLACDSSKIHDNTISLEDLENYLDKNPDEADFFEIETFVRVKNKLQAMEEIQLQNNAFRISSDREARAKFQS